MHLRTPKRVIIGKVPRPERARDDEPFFPQRLISNLNSQGKTALYFSQPEKLLSHLEEHLQAEDLVLFMSNGGFSGIQHTLAARLQDRYEIRLAEYYPTFSQSLFCPYFQKRVPKTRT